MPQSSVTVGGEFKENLLLKNEWPLAIIKYLWRRKELPDGVKRRNLSRTSSFFFSVKVVSFGKLVQDVKAVWSARAHRSTF